MGLGCRVLEMVGVRVEGVSELPYHAHSRPLSLSHIYVYMSDC